MLNEVGCDVRVAIKSSEVERAMARAIGEVNIRAALDFTLDAVQVAECVTASLLH